MELEYELPSYSLISQYNKTYRNPIIYAQELQEEMKREGLTQAELARKHRLSRARVDQWLSLLKLPREQLNEIEALGDYWVRQVITERNLRTQGRAE